MLFPTSSFQRTCLALAVSHVLVSVANGATITVDSGTDDGTGCTLREAIVSANTDTETGGCSAAGGFGYDHIEFSPDILPATITLGSSLPSITDNVYIHGPGADLLTVDGNGMHRVFYVYSGYVSMENLAVTGGSATFGGAIAVAENRRLDLTNCLISGNSATSGAGGGIHAAYGSTVELTGCTISNNSTTDASDGFGGGIYAYGARINIVNSTVSGNSAGYSGGGISAHFAEDSYSA